MESTKQNKKSFANLRSYEQNQVMSFLSLEDFTDKDLISKKFFQYFKLNYKKLILNYIISSSKRKAGLKEMPKKQFGKFYKKFLKGLFLENKNSDNKEEYLKLENTQASDSDFTNQQNFKIF